MEDSVLFAELAMSMPSKDNNTVTFEGRNYILRNVRCTHEVNIRDF